MGPARGYAVAAISLSPASYEAHLTRALIEDFGVWPGKEGLLAAQEAVRLAPTEPAAHPAPGKRLVRQGKRFEARQSFIEALRPDPNASAARSELAHLDLRGQRLGRAAVALIMLVAGVGDEIVWRVTVGVSIAFPASLIRLIRALSPRTSIRQIHRAAPTAAAGNVACHARRVDAVDHHRRRPRTSHGRDC